MIPHVRKAEKKTFVEKDGLLAIRAMILQSPKRREDEATFVNDAVAPGYNPGGPVGVQTAESTCR